MAIYDVKDPTGPELLTFCTKCKDEDRFKSVGAFNGDVVCTVRLNPSYEAHFSMTPDHARDIAVRLIDAAEKAEFEQTQQAEKRAEELRRVNERRELRRINRKATR